MYKALTVEDKVRVPPSKFHLKLDEALKSSLEDRWSGTIEKDIGVILSVVSIEKMGDGQILPGDGALYFPVTFRLLTYTPEVHEIVKGDVIDITEFGVFIRMGPLDGMIHVSQLMDDFVSFDPKNSMFRGRDTKRILKEGDVVKARVISVSIETRQYKIGLTTRQPGLGSLAWPKIVRREEAPKPQAERREKPRKR